SQRQLDLKEQLLVGQSHGASGLDHGGIDTANTGVSVANQRQQGIERQGQNRQPPGARSDPRRWKKKTEEGEAGNGLDNIRATEHGPAELRNARDQDAEWDADERREQRRNAGERDVFESKVEDLLTIRHHELQEIHAITSPDEGVDYAG